MFKATVIRKARFVYSPFSAETMVSLATTVMDAVIDRMAAGQNCNDQSARPLKKGTRPGTPDYPESKIQAGLQPIRNWISPRRYPAKRIKTLRAMKVKSATENRAIIGFVDPRADQIAHFNNRREKQFGVSPNDRNNALLPAVKEALRSLITVQKVS